MAYYAGVAIAANVINQNMRQRRNNVYRTGIASLEDTEVALRINSAEIDTLVDEYHLWRRAQFGINASYNRSSARMVSFLAYLARGGYFHQCARTEGVAKTTLMLHVKEVASFFSCEARKYIELPAPVEFAALSTSLQDPANHQVRCSLLCQNNFGTPPSRCTSFYLSAAGHYVHVTRLIFMRACISLSHSFSAGTPARFVGRCDEKNMGARRALPGVLLTALGR